MFVTKSFSLWSVKFRGWRDKEGWNNCLNSGGGGVSGTLKLLSLLISKNKSLRFGAGGILGNSTGGGGGGDGGYLYYYYE